MHGQMKCQHLATKISQILKHIHLWGAVNLEQVETGLRELQDGCMTPCFAGRAECPQTLPSLSSNHVGSQDNSGQKWPQDVSIPTSCSKKVQRWGCNRLRRALSRCIPKIYKDGGSSASLGIPLFDCPHGEEISSFT